MVIVLESKVSRHNCILTNYALGCVNFNFFFYFVDHKFQISNEKQTIIIIVKCENIYNNQLSNQNNAYKQNLIIFALKKSF